MISRFFRRRTIWCPTLLGWVFLAVLGSAPFLFWAVEGESFLAVTARQPADVLVVESWIGFQGVKAAAAEFEKGGYRYIVAAGSVISPRLTENRISYADQAEHELLRLNVPADRIIAVTSRDTERQRTFETAAAAWRALQARGIKPKGVNVFTLGAHARRSRMVFDKVFRPDTKTGVISWTPVDYGAEPWWRSSERAGDMMKETVGYVYELLLNSRRHSNSPAEPKPAEPSSAAKPQQGP